MNSDLWSRLADWCLPPGSLTFDRLDGYLPPAPAGYRWVHRPAALVIVPREAAVGERWPTGQWELHRTGRQCRHHRRQKV